MTGKTPTPLFRLESPDDREAVYNLHRDAFGRVAEAVLVERLRNGGFQRLSLVAEIGARIVGHLLLSGLTLRTTGRDLDAMALAPLAVLPGWQRKGIGTAMVRDALQRAADRPECAVIVLGEPAYYRRFGFTAETASPLRCPFPGADWAFQAIELRPGALAEAAGAEVIYPPPFAEVEG